MIGTELLVVILVFSIVLIIAASLTLGRKLADREYQRLAGLNGVRQIQSRINIRTHANRIVFGITFLLIFALPFTPLDAELRIWISRGLAIFLLGVFTTSAVLDWVDERLQMRILIHDRHGEGTEYAEHAAAYKGQTQT